MQLHLAPTSSQFWNETKPAAEIKGHSSQMRQQDVQEDHQWEMSTEQPIPTVQMGQVFIGQLKFHPNLSSPCNTSLTFFPSSFTLFCNQPSYFYRHKLQTKKLPLPSYSRPHQPVGFYEDTVPNFQPHVIVAELFKVMATRFSIGHLYWNIFFVLQKKEAFRSLRKEENQAQK